MRKTAILGIALLAAALAGCGKKADEPMPENQVAPADQLSAPAPAVTEPAPMTEPSSDMSAPAAEGTAPEQGMTPPAEEQPKAAE